ncbi:MAG: type II secretion system F family protein [Verrucomicrobiota bacterium]|jgi:type IV pilus assembly protein PilC
MPTYQYQAVDTRGRSRVGTMPAQDESNLEQKLKQAGLWCTDAAIPPARAVTAKAKRSDVRRFKLRGARGRRELIDFCTLMTFQVRAGIPLIRALDVACQDCKNPGFKDVLIDLQRQIESGVRIHEAMAKYPGVFSIHFLSVIKAGETTSKLPEAFDDLRNYLEWMERVVSDVRQATIYPAIVITVIAAFVIFLFTFVIPVFSALLEKLHVEQPLMTQVVFTLGRIAQATWWLWLPLLLLLVLTVTVGKRVSPRIAFAIDQVKLRLPIFGELNLMLALSRFTHNLSILYRSGLPILQGLNLCQQGLIGNKVLERAVAAVEEEVKTGNTIGEAMHRHPIFPALLLRMVAMGETSGNLDSALDNVSAYYTDVVPRRIKSLFSVLEPALMLFLIVLVGCVALAIYLPIISLMGAIK